MASLPAPLITSFLDIDSELKASAIHLIDALTNQPSALRSEIPVDEMRHFPDDDVFDSTTGAQYFLHRHAAGQAPPSVHIHFFQRWAPTELALNEADTITTHLAALELNDSGDPQAWFVVNQWVVGDYWQPAEDTIRLFSDWKINAADEGRGSDVPEICHRWLAAYLRLNLMETIYPLLNERDELLDKLIDAQPGTNVLDERSHEVLSYRAIDFNAQLASWKRRFRRT